MGEGVDEKLAAWAKSSTNMAWNLDSRLSGLERAQNHIQSSMQEKSEEPKHSTDANIDFISLSKPQPSITQAQPITIINPEPIIPQIEGKGIATDEQVEDQRKLVKA
ncbi:hypothetical protein Tco_0564163 [Tanacetum coccineum]